MTIRRGFIPLTDAFTIIPNDWVRDRRLSRRARGLLAELMSHAEGFETNERRLADAGPEGRHAIRTALAELEEHGYLRREWRMDPESNLRDGMDYALQAPPDRPGGRVSGGPKTEPPGGPGEMPNSRRSPRRSDSRRSENQTAGKKNSLLEDQVEDQGGCVSDGASPAGARELPYPDRCSRHQSDPAPGPCGPCGDARRAAKAAEEARVRARLAEERRVREEAARAREQAIAACEVCDEDGWLRDERGEPLKCLHDVGAGRDRRPWRERVRPALELERDA